jgi:hypothetical protein
MPLELLQAHDAHTNQHITRTHATRATYRSNAGGVGGNVAVLGGVANLLWTSFGQNSLAMGTSGSGKSVFLGGAVWWLGCQAA